MGQLTEDQVRAICNFREDAIDAMLADLNAHEAVDALDAPGACDLDILVTELSISGTDAFTLAAPTRTGQRKIIRCVAAASIPVGTLTVSSPDDTTGFVCESTFVFDTVGQELTFEATAALKWRCVGKKRAGGTADNVVVGTTVLTGKSMWQLYALSVTGTAVSDSTKKIPNGSCVGERIVIGCSTAASIPVGSILITGRSIIGGAVADLQAIGATSDTAVCEWDGQKWQILYSTGITLA